MTRRCVICGADFVCSPSDKTITCSKECSRQRKRLSHLGVSNHWSPEKRKRLSQQGQTPNLQMGTPAAQQSPIAGPFETNRNAKHWVLVDPQGQSYEVDNLALFVRSHPEWFSNPTSARTALGAIADCKAGTSRRKRPVRHYKGWTVTYRGPKD